MSHGPLKVASIAWGERTCTVTGQVWYLGAQTTPVTVAYAAIACSQFWLEARDMEREDAHVEVTFGKSSVVLDFGADHVRARDFASELARRMEAVR